MRYLWTLGLLSFLLLGVPGASLGQPEDPAEQMNEQGRAAYDQGDFGKALELFKAAYKARPLDKYLFNAAKSSARLGDLEGCIYFYQRYLKANPVAPDREKVEKDIERLKKQLADDGRYEVRITVAPEEAVMSPNIGRTTQATAFPASLFLKPGSYVFTFTLEGHRTLELPVTVAKGAEKPVEVSAQLQKKEGHGWLQVNCNKVGAKVFIEGTFVGQTPLPVQVVREGSYRVRVARPGFGTSNQVVKVSSGQTVVVEVELQEATGPVEDPNKNKVPEVTKEPFPWRAIALVTALVGGATAATGGGLYLYGVSQMEDASDNWGPKDGMEAYTQEYLPKYNSGRDKVVAGSWLFYSGLGVTACATAAWFLLPEPQRRKGTPMTFMPLQDGFAVSFQGTF